MTDTPSETVSNSSTPVSTQRTKTEFDVAGSLKTFKKSLVDTEPGSQSRKDYLTFLRRVSDDDIAQHGVMSFLPPLLRWIDDANPSSKIEGASGLLMLLMNESFCNLLMERGGSDDGGDGSLEVIEDCVFKYAFTEDLDFSTQMALILSRLLRCLAANLIGKHRHDHDSEEYDYEYEDHQATYYLPLTRFSKRFTEYMQGIEYAMRITPPKEVDDASYKRRLMECRKEWVLSVIYVVNSVTMHLLSFTGILSTYIHRMVVIYDITHLPLTLAWLDLISAMVVHLWPCMHMYWRGNDDLAEVVESTKTHATAMVEQYNAEYASIGKTPEPSPYTAVVAKCNDIQKRVKVLGNLYK